MKKYPIGERVVFPYYNQRLTGRVTEVLNGRRRVVADTGEREIVLLKALSRATNRVLILESRLDRSVRSKKRTYATMLQSFLEAYPGVEVLHERVHSPTDFVQLVKGEGKKIGTRVIHYIGHGDHHNSRETTLELTFGKLNLYDQASDFKGLKGKVLIFSCCRVGANLQVMAKIKEESGAAAVIGYRTDVVDSFTNLAEVLLYDRLFSGLSPKSAVRCVIEGLQIMGIRPEGTRSPVLVCV